MSKGSIWRKWDLHIHTPASHEHNYHLKAPEASKYDGDVWNKFIEVLEVHSEIPAIGITDYFSIEGYKKILEYKKNGKFQNKLILPNIEFRLDKFLSPRGDEPAKRLNYHVIFSDELDVEKIQTEFLQEIHIETELGEQRTLSRENINEIGKNLREHHKEFQDRTDYYIGCMTIYVSLDEIRRILREKASIFKGNYLLILSDDYWSQADWNDQSHLLRKTLLRKSDALFASNPNSRIWGLGLSEDYASQEKFIEEFGSIYPSIHGSDAHSFENLFKPDLDRFCWIKADTTFEGLRQIVFEPEERVRIQADSPEHRKSLYTIDEIELTNTQVSPDVGLTEQTIPFNRNLVAVTGGKGSGKTALLDLIANSFENRTRSGGRDTNSFVQRIQDQKPDLSTKITFLGKDITPFSKELGEIKFFESSNITYLPQGKIEEYSGDKERMDSTIRGLIFSNIKVVEQDYKSGFRELNDYIDELAREIDEINREIHKIEEETRREIITIISRNKTLKEGQLQNKKDELKVFLEKVIEGSKQNIEELKRDETKFRLEHSNLVSLIQGYDDFTTDFETQIIGLNSRIDILNSRANESPSIPIIPNINMKPQTIAVEKSKKASLKLLGEISKKIELKEKELEKLSGEEQTHANMLKAINEISDEIKGIEEQLEEFQNKKEKIAELEKQRVGKFKNLINKYIELRKFYRKVIGTFSKGKSEILSGIDFQSAIHFDKEWFIKYGIELLDSRTIKANEVESLAVDLETSLSKTTKSERNSSIDAYLVKIQPLRNMKKETRTSYDFYKWCFTDYFNLSTDILFNKVRLGKLSMGQKGTILIKLFLAEGDYPLIVDQPEESLDNKFIYTELVKAIRNAKRNRQVIIATNNANLVVNADAEQVIVAEYVDNVISYKLGTLENREIREEIIPILEGGEEAFKKREEKYSL